jgi:hydrogenase-4 component B
MGGWQDLSNNLTTISLAALAYWAMLGIIGAGVVLALVLPGKRLSYIAAALCAAAAGVAAVVSGIGVLAGLPGPQAQIPSALPFGPLLIHLDPLGAFFLLVIGVVITPVAVFSIGYFGPDTDARSAHGGIARSLRPYGALLCLLFASLVLIMSAADAVLFLIAWEAMAFLSYLAGAYHYMDRRASRSMFRMLAVSEGATAGVIAAFLVLFGASGTFAYAGLRIAGPALPLAVRSILFLLVLAGFGAKLGLMPFQFWLVQAHPQAPGPISSLLSAVIIELALYGMFRFDFDLLGTGPLWWGLVAVIVGMLTALGGVLYCLMQRNLKRLLAYSSVEHGGILLVGLGATLTFTSLHLPLLAAIAAMATLYHVLNHATFKGLLFLGAGAVEHATGTVALDRLGGLARRLPVVTAAFLVGALAISAVPPFNGFISEWMLLESLLQSFAVSNLLAKVVLMTCGAVLALVAGIGVTAFVRAVGVPFLGLPRSPQAVQAHPVGWTMRLGMVWLALLCLLLGVTPPLVLAGLDPVTTSLVGVSVFDRVVPPLYTGHPGPYAPLVSLGGGLFSGLIPGNGLVVIAAPNFTTIDSPSYLLLFVLVLLLLVWIGRRLIRPLGAQRVAPVWAGGIARFSPRMAYSGVAFSNPIRLMFNAIYRSHADVELAEPAAHHRRGRIVYRQHIPDPFERLLYRRLRNLVARLAQGVKFIQSGDTNQYIAYIFGIVLLILLLRLF